MLLGILRLHNQNQDGNFLHIANVPSLAYLQHYATQWSDLKPYFCLFLIFSLDEVAKNDTFWMVSLFLPLTKGGEVL